MLDIQPPSGIAYTFPFPQMKAARDDEAFFPKGHWHAKGLSLKVVRDAYLAAIKAPVRVDDTLLLSSEPSEVLEGGGVTKNLPIYVLRNDHVSVDVNRNALLAHAVGNLFPNPYIETRYFHNSRPAIAQSVLIVSDSYGNLTSEVLAGAFQNVLQITSNFLAADRIGQVIDHVTKLEHIDRVILLTEEGQVGMIIAWAHALGSAPAQKQSPRQNSDTVFKWNG